MRGGWVEETRGQNALDANRRCQERPGSASATCCWTSPPGRRRGIKGTVRDDASKLTSRGGRSGSWCARRSSTPGQLSAPGWGPDSARRRCCTSSEPQAGSSCAEDPRSATLSGRAWTTAIRRPRYRDYRPRPRRVPLSRHLTTAVFLRGAIAVESRPTSGRPTHPVTTETERRWKRVPAHDLRITPATSEGRARESQVPLIISPSTARLRCSAADQFSRRSLVTAGMVSRRILRSRVQQDHAWCPAPTVAPSSTASHHVADAVRPPTAISAFRQRKRTALYAHCRGA